MKGRLRAALRLLREHWAWWLLPLLATLLLGYLLLDAEPLRNAIPLHYDLPG